MSGLEDGSGEIVGSRVVTTGLPVLEDGVYLKERVRLINTPKMAKVNDTTLTPVQTKAMVSKGIGLKEVG